MADNLRQAEIDEIERLRAQRRLITRLEQADTAADEELDTAKVLGLASNAFGAQFNRFLVTLPGIPFDAIDSINTFLDEKLGVAPVREAISEATGGIIPADIPQFRGSERFERFANEVLRIPTRTGREGTPQELEVERIAGRVGEEIGAALPFIGAVGRAARLLSPATRVGAAPIRQAARARPLATAGAEAGLAATAGLGAGLAAEVVGPDAPPGAQLGAEVVGQIGGAFAPSGIARAVGAAGRQVSGLAGQARATRILEGGAPRGTFAEQEAADIVQGAARDREGALRGLEEGRAEVEAGEVLGAPTSAQLTDDTGLLDLEKTVNATDPAARQLGEDSKAVLNRDLTETLNKNAGVASAQVAQEFVQGRVDRLVTLLNKRTEQAVSLAKGKLDLLDPKTSAQDASIVVRKELEDALASARVDERALYRAVDDSVVVSTTPIKASIENMKARALKADRAEDIPDVERLFRGDEAELTEGSLEFLRAQAERQFRGEADIPEVTSGGIFLDAEPLAEIQGLRSRILQDIRKEAAQEVPNRALLSNLNELQSVALEAMDATGKATFGSEGAKLRAALDFSKTLNDTYTRGPIGKILRLDARGGQRITDEQSLEILFKAGTGGKVNMRALLTAGGGSQQLLGATEEFIRNQFAEMAVNPATGIVNPAARKQFLKKFDGALEAFPQLKTQLEDAVAAQEIAATRAAINDNRVRGLGSTTKSRAALFLDQEPQKAMARLLASRKPETVMKQLVRQVGKDKTGEALEGLKTMFVEEVFRRSTVRGPEGKIFNGASFRKFINDKGVVKSMAALFKDDPTALKRFQIIDKSLRVAERSLRGRRLVDVGGDVSFMVSALGKLLGTKVAPKIGVGALVGAGIGSQISRKILGNLSRRQINALLEASITDPEIMKTLLTIPTKTNAKVMQRRLRGHLINIGGILGSDPGEQE